MADSLVTKSGAPYNMVKENGRWYFTSAIFPPAYKSLPKELRLVPKEMIPSSTNPGGGTAYIPESSITTYFKGDEFQQTFRIFAGSSNQQPSGATNMYGVSPQISAESLVNGIVGTLSKFDEQKRTTQSAASVKTQNGVQLPSGWFGTMATTNATTTSDAMAAALKKTPSGDYAYNYLGGQIVDANKTPFLFLPNASGKIQMYAEQAFQADFARSGADNIRKWQKAIGSTIVDGIPKPDEITAILAYVRNASFQNFSGMQAGVKDFKPVDALKYTQQYAAAMKAATAAQSNIGRPITSTTTQATEITHDWVSSTLNGYFQQYLGMDAPAAMVKKFTKELQAKAKANPAKQKVTTTQLNEAGDSTRTVQTDSGFGQEQAATLAMQKAKAQPGVVGYQASTRYMDVIMKMIENPVG